MRLKITMKSGRVYKTDKLETYHIETSYGSVRSISWKECNPNQTTGVLLYTITLNDIEAIEVIR